MTGVPYFKISCAGYTGLSDTIALHLLMTVIRLLTVCPRQKPSGSPRFRRPFLSLLLISA